MPNYLINPKAIVLFTDHILLLKFLILAEIIYKKLLEKGVLIILIFDYFRFVFTFIL